MRIVVAGGGLQGAEAAYLAFKAGWSTTLIDKRESPPASGLCDRFVRLDLLAGGLALERHLEQADLVVPALENQAALNRLQQAASCVGVPLAHDAAAYAITVSKLRSDALFAEYGIPAPRPWPGCSLPVIVKPSESSGSRGVRLIARPGEVDLGLAATGPGAEQWVVQEFLEGDSYSIEVLGCHGHYLPLQVTDLEMDADYDCRRVTAPTRLPPGRTAEFQALAARIAGLIGLNGIMDVEVIDHGGILKVLEIDARLPSQTPATVYCSTGINMLVALYEIFVLHRLPAVPADPARKVIYEHILVTPGRMETLGEHIISAAGHLRLETGFFGADEAITDYVPGAGRWVATLIHQDADAKEVRARRHATIAAICRQHHLSLPDFEFDERPELC